MNIDYTTVKELKDAGFPLRELVEYSNFKDIQKYVIEIDGNIYYIPTLSDLIEACGEGFTALVNVYDDVWFAGELDVEDSFKRGYGEGKTPEEAVAKLWLALNKT